jgi:hypothetical protein
MNDQLTTSNNTESEPQRWWFQGDRIFWSLLVVFIFRAEKHNKPMSLYTNADWDFFEKNIRKKVKKLIDGAFTKELEGVTNNAQRLAKRKLIAQKEKTIVLFNEALGNFRLTIASINASKTSNPLEYEKFWQNLTEWANKHEYLKKVTNDVIPDKTESGKEIVLLTDHDAISAEVQHFIHQYMFTGSTFTNISKSIGTGGYERVDSDYPVADISDKRRNIFGHSEIRPLPHEQEQNDLPIPLDVLQNRMLAVRDELKKKGGHAVFVFNAVLYLWWQKTKGSGTDAGTANILIEDICKYMNKPRRSDRTHLFAQKSIDLVKEHLKILARITINIRDLTIQDPKTKREKRVQYAENLITLNPYSNQDDLWQTGAWESDWIGVRVRIGEFCRFGIDDGKKFAPLPSVASIDPRFRVEQMLGWFLSVYLRINATKTNVVFLNVGMTLETIGLREEVESIARLEKALDYLIDLGDLIRSWEYIGETIDDRLNRRQKISNGVVRISASDLKIWLEQRIKVEASPNLVKAYQELAKTHQEKKALSAPQTPPATPSQNLRDEVRLVIGREFNGNQKRASESIGVEASTLSRFLNGNNVRNQEIFVKWLNQQALTHQPSE